MTRTQIFDSPLLLGFDEFERIIDRVSKSAEGYPPYNIEQVGESELRITLAVAGFSEGDLSVLVEGNQLIIRGCSSVDDSAKVFLHRGIAARQFQRSFVLAENIKVRGASQDMGLLHIDLESIMPEKKIRTISIRKGSGGGARAKTVEGRITNL
jgi:HSP20 family molecular chaperone IbpA